MGSTNRSADVQARAGHLPGGAAPCALAVLIWLSILGAFWRGPPVLGAEERLRVLMETDAGGDPDDEQSLVRFLLYTCEWDVEGIVANRPTTRRPENKHRADTGLGIVRALVQAYGECFTNLVQHDPRYPDPSRLLARTVAGYSNVEDGVNLILAAVDSPDPRPLWYADWGSDRGSGVVNMRRALDRVWLERGPADYARFKNRLRILGYDQFHEHTARSPRWQIWVDTFEPPQNGKRWYHRFSALTAKAGGFDLVRDVLTGHGPLGAAYPTNTTHWQKEGDTPAFLYLMPTGLNDPNQPTWGSWAGRYGPNENFPGQPYFWANQVDVWSGTTNRDNTLARWAVALQNDFRARLDWCVRLRAQANHPPRVQLNGVEGSAVLPVRAAAGAATQLSAEGSSDPDGQSLRYDWFVYAEPGTYRGPVRLEGAGTSRATVHVPHDAAGRTIHVIVAATDAGEPPLTRYRRALITVAE